MTDTLALANPNSPMTEMTVEAKDLPSRGLGYPDGLVIRYRSYSFGEIKKVSTTNDIDLPQIIEVVMSGISIDGGFDKYKLSFVDMLYIGLLRRVSSQGHMKYQMPYSCEKCEQVSQAIFGSGDIDFQEISEEVPSLPIEVELGGTTFQFNFPTVQNMLDVKGARKDKKKAKKSAALEITASTVINMDAETAYAKLEAITDPDEMEVLNEIDKLLFHDIKPVKAICKSKVEDENGITSICNFENFVSIEGKELLVRPFRDGEAPARNKIRFINK